MRNILLRYLIIWAPVLLAAYLLDFRHTYWQAIGWRPELFFLFGQIALWVIGAFFLIGWAVNTGVFAYHYPRQALAFLFAYFGLSALLIMRLHDASFGSVSYLIFEHGAGALTYRPLYMFYRVLLEFHVFAEMWTAGIIAGVCAVGFLCGVLYRRIRPNPYHPTFSGKQRA